MPFSNTIFDLVVLLGIVQAIVMAVLLLTLNIADKSKILLVLILFVMALLSFKILLHTLGLWNYTLYRYFPLAIDTALQPLLYLYAFSLTGKQIGLFKKAMLFVPATVFLIHAIVVYARVLPLHNMEEKDLAAESLYYNTVKNFEDWVAVISGVLYWMLSYKRVQAYRQWLFNSQSDTRYPELGWIKNILLTTGLLVLALVIVVLLENLLSVHFFFHLEVFYVYLAVITYYLSLKGYQYYHTPRVGIANSPIVAEAAEEVAATKITADLEIVKSRIVYALETDRLYLEPELSLKDLSAHISYPVSMVSAAINQGFKMNFRNLVNNYRVEEVKRCLANPELSHLSLLGIALECGFNSEASFYRIFRRLTGLSPNDYIGTHLKQ